MPRLNLINFETVCCIDRVGTFSAAALRLNASQPAITARVRELEESLGITLFQKRGRRMELTIEGRKLIEDIAPLVARLEEAVFAHTDPSAARGIVRIGVAPVALRWFPDVVQQLQHDMPQVQYEVDIDVGRSILQKLEAGKLDIALVAGRVEIPEIVTISLCREELRWLMSAAVATWRDGRALSTREILESAPIWLLPRSSIIFPRALAALQAHNANLQNINTCTSMSGIMEIAARSGGIGLMTASSAAPLIASGTLVEVSPEMSPQQLDVTLAFHKDQQQSVVRQVVDRMVEFDRQHHANVAGVSPVRSALP